MERCRHPSTKKGGERKREKEGETILSFLMERRSPLFSFTFSTAALQQGSWTGSDPSVTRGGETPTKADGNSSIRLRSVVENMCPPLVTEILTACDIVQCFSHINIDKRATVSPLSRGENR